MLEATLALETGRATAEFITFRRLAEALVGRLYLAGPLATGRGSALLGVACAGARGGIGASAVGGTTTQFVASSSATAGVS